MIQIDDAGSGSLVGGTCIGIIRTETNDYHYKIIPLELYNKKNFKNKTYLDYVVTIVKELFDKLKVNKKEQIQVCRGYMFDNLRKWLKSENYSFKSTKIGEPLQTKIENSFEKYTISLGLPVDFIRYTKFPFHFHSILKWVYADYKNRKKLCKTGWKSWSKYGNLKTNLSYEYIKKTNFICLKCGSSLKDNTRVKVISYTSNRFTKIYLHETC